jgi:hypothetical protein
MPGKTLTSHHPSGDTGADAIDRPRGQLSGRVIGRLPRASPPPASGVRHGLAIDARPPQDLILFVSSRSVLRGRTRFLGPHL